MKKVRLAIIGSGFIGKGIARHLGEEFATSLVGARNVIAVRTWAEDPGLSDQYVLVFAHGRNVNVRCFDRQFDEILRSRLEPLDRVAEMFPTAPAVLVSSTAALSPRHSRRARSLPAMQRIFEERFVSLFGERASILRVGTLVGPGSQFSEGLAALRKTILLKRLRSAGAPKLLWADLPLVAEAVRQAATRPGTRWLVASSDLLDLNAELDRAFPGARLEVPSAVFGAIWEALGIRSAFLTVSGAEAAVSAWPRFPVDRS